MASSINSKAKNPVQVFRSSTHTFSHSDDHMVLANIKPTAFTFTGLFFSWYPVQAGILHAVFMCAMPKDEMRRNLEVFILLVFLWYRTAFTLSVIAKLCCRYPREE